MFASKVEDIYELSPLQRGMLLHSEHDGATDMYLGQHAYTVDGPLDPDALVAAWRGVFAAHPALRTSFHWDGLDRPLQVVHRDVAPPAHRHDWSDAEPAAQRERLDRLLADDRAQGFDLKSPPLQRLYLIRCGPDRHLLAWSHHHLLLDGWSVPIFMTEVMTRYRMLTADGPPPSPAPPYRDYIAWLQNQDMAAAQRFWAATLAGVTPARLVPLRAPDPLRGTGAVDRHVLDLPPRLEQGLRAAAARYQVAVNALLQAAWAIVLRRYTGSGQVTFGCVTSGRPAELPGVDRMVGMFVNTLPVPVTVPDDGDLGSWLRDLQARHAAIRAYEFSPLADIKKWAGAPGQQLFETLLVVTNYAFNLSGDGLSEALTVRTEEMYDKVSLPLALIVTPEPMSQLQLLVHRDRFAPGFPDEVLDCLRPTLEALVDADRVELVTKAAGAMVVPPTTDGPPTVDRPVAVGGPTASDPTAGPVIPPATPGERAIATVYQEVLNLPEVDVTRSFFELGGDSFAAVQVIGRIEGATVAMIAANPSVRGLAQALDDAAALAVGEVAAPAVDDAAPVEESSAAAQPPPHGPRDARETL